MLAGTFASWNSELLTSQTIQSSDAESIAKIIRRVILKYEGLGLVHLPIGSLVCDNAPAYVNACAIVRQTNPLRARNDDGVRP